MPPKRCEYKRYDSERQANVPCHRTFEYAFFRRGTHFCTWHECKHLGCFECKRSAVDFCAQHAHAGAPVIDLFEPLACSHTHAS